MIDRSDTLLRVPHLKEACGNDLAQIAAENIAKSGKTLPEDLDECSRFLSTVIANALIDEERKHYSQKRGEGRVKSLDEMVHDASEASGRLIERVAGTATTPTQAVIRKERFLKLISAMNESLSAKQFMAMVNRHFHGYTLAETADRMGCTETQVAGYERHARKTLRQRFPDGMDTKTR